MNVKVVVHEAEEGGFWGEVPALPGCASQGETLEELMHNLREAVEGWLSSAIDAVGEGERVLDLALLDSGAAKTSPGSSNSMDGGCFGSTEAITSTGSQTAPCASRSPCTRMLP